MLNYSLFVSFKIASTLSSPFKLYKEGAASEIGWVQREIGYMYENGYGVPKNYTTALEWYKKAAEKGDQYAQERLQVLQPIGTIGGVLATILKV